MIEDEVRLAGSVAAALREGAGLAVDCLNDGCAGADAAQSGLYDMLVIDLMLPGLDGFEIVRRLRGTGNRTPILMLTAIDERSEIIRLLNAGADDYLTKPFDLGELLARVKALIRRGKGTPQPVIQLGTLTLNTVEQTLRSAGQLVEVSPTEYRIMEYMMFRPRAVASQRQILEHLYDFSWDHHSNVIEAHISNLRRKLRSVGESNAIETLRGRGYRLETPDRTG